MRTKKKPPAMVAYVSYGRAGWTEIRLSESIAVYKHYFHREKYFLPKLTLAAVYSASSSAKRHTV